MILHFLTEVLEELIGRLIRRYEILTKELDTRVKPPKEIDEDLSQWIKGEVQKQIKQELAKQKARRTTENKKSR
jgi:hypothetical protein